MYWILFWPFVTLASSRNPIWLILLAAPVALVARVWWQFGIHGRPPERGACATLGLLDLGMVGMVAGQKLQHSGIDASVIRAAIGLPVVLWLAAGLPSPNFGLPTRGRHARRLIALVALALVASAAVEWLAGLIPSMTKGATPPLFWPLFLAPLPFYLTPLWSVLSEGWRVQKPPPRLPGLSELWELPAPDETRPLSDRERLVRALLQAESGAYLILLNRLDDPGAAASRVRAAEEELFRRGEVPPLDDRVVKWATERLVHEAMKAGAGNSSDRLLLRDALDELPPELRRMLSLWLVGGDSFAELLASTGLTSTELRIQVREGLGLLTDAAIRSLQGGSSVVTSPALSISG